MGQLTAHAGRERPGSSRIPQVPAQEPPTAATASPPAAATVEARQTSRLLGIALLLYPRLLLGEAGALCFAATDGLGLEFGGARCTGRDARRRRAAGDPGGGRGCRRLGCRLGRYRHHRNRRRPRGIRTGACCCRRGARLGGFWRFLHGAPGSRSGGRTAGCASPAAAPPSCCRLWRHL
jgi:hypothetical protein